MCYHKSQTNSIDYIADYYAVSYGDEMAQQYAPHFHENGFDFQSSAILTAEKSSELLPYTWGFIPWWAKSYADGVKLRVQTLNCISEEMFDKSSFRDSAKAGKRCLIPCTGFYEWRWMDPKGKHKVPYYISMTAQPMFSIAGLYSSYKDKSTDLVYYTYTVLTTRANSLMEKVHNSKKRMPVIIPREYEKDWLNPSLNKDDVLALCQPVAGESMNGYTISKLITSKTEETDVSRVMDPEMYEDVIARDSGVTMPSSDAPEASGEKKPAKKKAAKPKGDDNQTQLF